MTTATPTTTSPALAALPAGHDDKRSPWFVPAEMREHYRPGTPQDIYAWFYGTDDGLNRRALVATARMRTDPQWSDYFAREDRRRHAIATGAGGGQTHPRTETFQHERRVIADQLNPDELALGYHRQAALPAAHRAAEAAHQHAVNAAHRTALGTCKVCGAIGTTQAVTVAYTTATVSTKNADNTAGPNLCAYCAALVPELVTAARADDDVDGRPRRDAVAAWLRDRL